MEVQILQLLEGEKFATGLIVIIDVFNFVLKVENDGTNLFLKKIEMPKYN